MFKTIQYLDQHIMYKHALCKICDEALPDDAALKVHRENSHQSEKKSEGGTNI